MSPSLTLVAHVCKTSMVTRVRFPALRVFAVTSSYDSKLLIRAKPCIKFSKYRCITTFKSSRRKKCGWIILMIKHFLNSNSKF